MNKIELRIKYKSDTGLHPVWNNNTWFGLRYNRYQRNDNYLGNPKSEYTKWLEGFIGIDSNELRMEYKFDTGDEAISRTYYKKYKDIVVSVAYDRKLIEIYSIDYCFWLESKICNNVSNNDEL